MQVVSFSPIIPFDGVAHAGGEYYLRHIGALKRAGIQVTIVAPRTDEHERVKPPDGVQVELVDLPGGRVNRVLRFLSDRAFYAQPPHGFASGIRRNKQVTSVLGRADLVEFQWTQTAGLLQSLKDLVPSDIPTVCIAHDVIVQALSRQAQHEGLSLPVMLMRRLRLWLGFRDERRAVRAVDAVVTFSQKDALLLSRSTAASKIHVIEPSVEPRDDRWPIRTRAAGTKVIFVGAFDRAENADAAMWLIRDIWPHVQRVCPAARLLIVGAHPTLSMRTAAVAPSIELTGYVVDLVPYYAQAAVAVVPLRLGAGVKFKTISAMFWDLPVVSTTIGAEGVADASTLLQITDTAEEMALGVLTALSGGPALRRRVTKAREAVTRSYGDARFQKNLQGLYRDLSQRVPPDPR